MALPGVRTVLKDRFYTLSRNNVPEGIRIVVLGRRSNTPVTGTDNYVDAENRSLPGDYYPYVPRSEQDVIVAFGAGSELHKGYLETVAGGAARVTLIPMPVSVTDSDLTSSASGNAFDLAFDAAETALPDIIVPFGRGGNVRDWERETASPSDNDPFGFAADNSSGATTSLAVRVANKCKEITDRSNPVFAVMGIKPVVDTGTGEPDVTQSDLSTHFNLATLIDRDADAAGENGSYVSIVGTEIAPPGYYDDFGFSNGAGMYAGLLSSLASENAATGKRLFNVSRMRYVPTRPQQQTLIDKGVVPVAQNYARQAVIVDALTFGKATSDYARLSTLRIVFDAIQLIRASVEGYVGAPATMQHRNAMETAVSSALRSMMVAGALVDADFVVDYIPRESRAIINLVLQPAFEMRNIDIAISIQL